MTVYGFARESFLGFSVLALTAGLAVDCDGSVGDDVSAGDAATDAGPDAEETPAAVQQSLIVASNIRNELVCRVCREDRDCAGLSRCIWQDELDTRVCMTRCNSWDRQCPAGSSCSKRRDSWVCVPWEGRCCVDKDGDGYGSSGRCGRRDCDDRDPAIHPDAPERCNGRDDNCDGVVDEGNPEAGKTCDSGKRGACAPGTTTCQKGNLVCKARSAPAAEVCDGIDNDCDGSIDNGNPGGGAACTTGASGACTSGILTCTGGALICKAAQSPAAEQCNGQDDDCDGQVDEELGSTTCGVGACKRTVSNCVLGASQTCTPGTGSAEICDGIDNDCDGVVDNGDPGGGVACSTGKAGACGAGTTACSAGAIVCKQSTQPGPETCNGLDDNCDGTVDEELGAKTCGRGACERTVSNCVLGLPQTCTPGAPSPETCDGADNDCDGIIDQGNPGGGVACSTGKAGACNPGITTCSAGVLVCRQSQTATAEICDGVDNDCNGAVDEGNPGGGLACNTGKPGTCAPGTTLCSAGALTCAQNRQPSPEICDGLDNDCNGAVDEGNPGGGFACNTGKPGTCAPGTTLCSAGALTCAQNRQPSPEICDGLDNDCNGAVDEGNPGGGLACNTGKPGTCAPGTTLCSAGALTCAQNRQPSPEICDGLDNDCNGAVDEGNPGGGLACNTGKPGTCAPGTTLCSAGALTCAQNRQPSPEICDGLDNDCNGTVDEGNPGGGLACNTGKPGTCAPGTILCSAGALTCAQNRQPSPEICDGLDNDCNGAVDEGNPGGGLACNTGKPGTCAPGTTLCSAGALTCAQNRQPSPEICDGLDNDCNGAVDEGNPGGGLACNTGKPGTCAPGTTLCSAGALTCAQNRQPSPEICDGLDNDCNGAVDEGNPGGGFACNTGKPGTCAPGTVVCAAGALACSQNQLPSQEICDGLDNDCNGQVDESGSLSLFRDADGDGHGNPAVHIQVCTPQAGFVALGDDCNDADARVFPGQTAFFSSPSAGSFDYNCDGVSQPRFPLGLICTGGCATNNGTWFGPPPPCGQIGLTAAAACVGSSCSLSPDSSLQQTCH